MQDSPSPTEISDKFRRKRNQILDAAAREINRRGLKGLTLVEVARAVGLNTPSVTYYFRRKDLLAEAAMERSIERWGALVARAEAEPDPRRAVRALIHAYLGLSAGSRRCSARPRTAAPAPASWRGPMCCWTICTGRGPGCPIIRCPISRGWKPS